MYIVVCVLPLWLTTPATAIKCNSLKYSMYLFKGFVLHRKELICVWRYKADQLQMWPDSLSEELLE